MDCHLKEARARLGGRRASVLLQILIGCLFIWSAWEKIANPNDFCFAIRQYQVVAWTQAAYLAVTIPWVELACGVFLLLGIFVPYAAYLLLVCLCVFTSAQISVLIHGYSIDCGCIALLGTTSKVTWLTVLRNLAVLALCLGVLGNTNSKTRAWTGLQMPWGRRLLLALVTLACAGALVVVASSMQLSTDQAPPYANEYSAARLDKARLQHIPVVVMFMSPTCEYCPCALEGPLSDPDLVRRFGRVECLAIHNRKIYDAATIAQVKSYSVSIYPSFVFVDPSGRIRSELVGYHKAEDIIKSIDSIAALGNRVRGDRLERSSPDIP